MIEVLTLFNRYLAFGKCAIASWRAAQRAQAARLPGMAFDQYGRRLARREIIQRRAFAPNTWKDLLNPVSCVRYFEFAFAAKALQALRNERGRLQALDISSPRLLPLWMAERLDLEVTMINPDLNDIKRSSSVTEYLPSKSRPLIAGAASGTQLPFRTHHFDVATSISVIEHIAADGGDREMLKELCRVVRPGGRIILSFPVAPSYAKEFRGRDEYRIGNKRSADGLYFFQRFYDSTAIDSDLLSVPGIKEDDRHYWVEDPPGWFQEYERSWMADGLPHVCRDPEHMLEHFRDAGTEHPSDRMGICCLSLHVSK